MRAATQGQQPLAAGRRPEAPLAAGRRPEAPAHAAERPERTPVGRTPRDTPEKQPRVAPPSSEAFGPLPASEPAANQAEESTGTTYGA